MAPMALLPQAENPNSIILSSQFLPSWKISLSFFVFSCLLLKGFANVSEFPLKLVSRHPGIEGSYLLTWLTPCIVLDGREDGGAVLNGTHSMLSPQCWGLYTKPIPGKRSVLDMLAPWLRHCFLLARAWVSLKSHLPPSELLWEKWVQVSRLYPWPWPGALQMWPWLFPTQRNNSKFVQITIGQSRYTQTREQNTQFVLSRKILYIYNIPSYDPSFITKHVNVFYNQISQPQVHVELLQWFVLIVIYVQSGAKVGL